MPLAAINKGNIFSLPVLQHGTLDNVSFRIVRRAHAKQGLIKQIAFALFLICNL